MATEKPTSDKPIEKRLPTVAELEFYASALNVARQRAALDLPRLERIAEQEAALAKVNEALDSGAGPCVKCRALFLLLGNVEAQLRMAEGRGR